jgi:hypothetical protein
MFSTNSEALDFIHDLLDTAKGDLGLASVWYGDENFVAPYPAAVVAPGGLVRNLYATRTFEIILQVTIFVMHGDLSVSYRTRTRDDIRLAESVTSLLHTDYTLGGNVVYGYVVSETPGAINRPKGTGIVSTSIAWNGNSRAQFGG